MNKKENIEALATDIYNWCFENDLWDDCCIYFGGNAWATWKEWSGEKGRKINEGLYLYEYKNPLDYFEYANPATLSMSFEGDLYQVVNDYGYTFPNWHNEFRNLFKKHGYYYELGNSWNLSICEE